MSGSVRAQVINALVEQIKKIDGELPYNSNVYNNVKGRLVFFDQVTDYPFICVVAGREYREYLPGGFKWAFLEISIKIYVRGDTPEEKLELLLEDIENILDANTELEYATNKSIVDINIVSIDTDEGVLAPLGIGEINIQVRYDL